MNRFAATVTAPWFHWGDIDAGGARIFRYIEKNILAPRGLELRPHLMTPHLAETYGVSAAPEPSLKSLASSESKISDLAAYLSAGLPRHLEQEFIEPSPPTP